MADRYVNYDKLLKERNRLGLDELSMIDKVNAFNWFINNMPLADVVEVRHGKWEKVSEKYPRYVCTSCRHLYNNKEYKYCPNCGAKMDGKESK